MKDRHRMALICREIERTGMSVLDFLQEMGAVSPWGTWHRLQIEELGRDRYKIRDGKGVDDMKKLTLEHKKNAVEIALTGGNPLTFLKSCGAANPSASWVYIKKCLQVKDPEKYERLLKVQEEKKQEEPAEDMPKSSAEVTFQGKGYEKAEKADQNTPKTEQKVKKTSGKPKKADPKLKIREADGAIGTWRRGYETITFILPAQRDGEEDMEIEMTPTEWMVMAEELPNVMKLFGMGGAAK